MSGGSAGEAAARGPFTVRPMEAGDLDQVALIERETFSLPWSREGFRASLEQEGTIYLTALDEAGRVAGYCGMTCSFDEAEITNVAVAAHCRRRGVARAMLEELLRRGKLVGVARFVLEVRVSNAPAIALYESLGFVCLGIRKQFYQRPIEDAAIMQRA